eukprot:SAG11_NODE_768_length_7269_cov_3.840725_8_plen_67_part_00
MGIEWKVRHDHLARESDTLKIKQNQKSHCNPVNTCNTYRATFAPPQILDTLKTHHEGDLGPEDDLQ